MNGSQLSHAHKSLLKLPRTQVTMVNSAEGTPLLMFTTARCSYARGEKRYIANPIQNAVMKFSTARYFPRLLTGDIY